MKILGVRWKVYGKDFFSYDEVAKDVEKALRQEIFDDPLTPEQEEKRRRQLMEYYLKERLGLPEQDDSLDFFFTPTSYTSRCKNLSDLYKWKSLEPDPPGIDKRSKEKLVSFSKPLI